MSRWKWSSPWDAGRAAVKAMMGSSAGGVDGRGEGVEIGDFLPVSRDRVAIIFDKRIDEAGLIQGLTEVADGAAVDDGW